MVSTPQFMLRVYNLWIIHVPRESSLYQSFCPSAASEALLTATLLLVAPPSSTWSIALRLSCWNLESCVVGMLQSMRLRGI
eukprot:m.468760 g.468760  ORF g.468760 m.468760 type:complete len:81 (+) comp21647_c1_seq1:87-329(+)